jgi:acyl dehydratase
MLDRSLVGRESDPVHVEVERGAIRRLAEALGDANPLYVDEAAARASGWPAPVAPPTFPVVLSVNERFRHSLDLGTRSLLVGEVAIEYGRPVVSGDRLVVKSRVADVQERTGASGSSDVLVLETDGRAADGQLVFRVRETLILRRG